MKHAYLITHTANKMLNSASFYIEIWKDIFLKMCHLTLTHMILAVFTNITCQASTHVEC